MQLKWNHRFVPFNNESTPGDRSNTSSPMVLQPQQGQQQPQQAQQQTRPSTRHSMSAVSVTDSPALAHLNNPQHSGAPVAPRELVTANCGKCHAPVGSLHNSWSQITNSYYTQTHPSYRAEGLRLKGEIKPPGAANTILGGCMIETLVCNNCREILGFLCVSAPEHKAILKNRQFLKLSRLDLISQTTKAPVAPHVEKPLEEGRTVPPIDTNHGLLVPEQVGRTDIISPITPKMEPEAHKDADNIAVRNTNDGTQTWREAHEEWYSKTRLTLSPGAFGKRILQLGGGMRPKPVGAPTMPPPPPSMQRSPLVPIPKLQHSGSAPLVRTTSHPNMMAQNTLPPIQQAVSRSLGGLGDRPMTTVLEEQKRDLDRMDAAVRHLQGLVDGLAASVDALRHEVRSRPRLGGANLHPEDQPTIDLLSDTVANLSSKVGDVDGIKLQVEALKRRMKRVEDGTVGAGPPTPSQGGDGFFHKPVPAPQRYESPFPIQQSSNQIGLPPSSNSVNGMKRTLGAQFMEGPDTKRQRSDGYMHDQRGPHLPPPHQQQPQYIPLPNGDRHDLLPAPQRQQSEDMYGQRRGPGRPRKYPTTGPDGNAMPELSLNTPAPWEQEGWATPVNVDGFYRPLAPTPGSDTTDRGRIIRRGSLNTPIMPFDSKRTRQRPMRNSDGVLIRKDGKPDGRSVSSAQNLRRFYDKKLAEKGTDGDEQSPGTPTHRAGEMDSGDDRSMYTDDSIRSSDQAYDHQQQRQQGRYDEFNSTTEASDNYQHEQQHHHHEDRHHHASIMNKMFPHGVTGERTRLDESAAQLFEPKNREEPHSRLQTHDAIVKSEVVDAVREDVVESEGPDHGGNVTAAVNVPPSTTINNAAAGDQELESSILTTNSALEQVDQSRDRGANGIVGPELAATTADSSQSQQEVQSTNMDHEMTGIKYGPLSNRNSVSGNGDGDGDGDGNAAAAVVADHTPPPPPSVPEPGSLGGVPGAKSSSPPPQQEAHQPEPMASGTPAAPALAPAPATAPAEPSATAAPTAAMVNG